MADLTNSRSLTDFQRNARGFIKGLNDSKKPMLITVNGKVEAVLVDPATYQDMEESLEKEQFLQAIREGEQAIKDGRTVSTDQAVAEIKAKYGL